MPELVAKLDESPALTARDFEEIRELAYRHFGLDLRAGKEEMIAARLGKVIRTQGHRSYRDFVQQVKGDSTGESLIALINALSTNHTSFLREPAHFEFLAKLAAGWPPQRRFSIWSAASSTGEEPYSLLFCLLGAMGLQAASRIEIQATDVSTRVLEIARRGIYQESAVEGLPIEWKQKFLLRGSGNSAGYVRVRPEYASRIRFERFNLLQEPSPAQRFAVIFCRNVMIYFDKPTREGVIRRLAGVLEPGGHLMVGHAESLAGLEHGLQFVQPAIYRKVGGKE